MAGDEDSGKTRHLSGPRAVGALLPPIIRPAFRKRAPAAAQILTDWTEIVGPALAALCLPRRLSGGTLTLACTGPTALELQHLAAALIDRINSYIGTIAVRRLRFVQQIVPSSSPPPRPPQRPAESAPAVVAAVAGLPAGALRDALERLGRTVLTSRPGR